MIRIYYNNKTNKNNEMKADNEMNLIERKKRRQVDKKVISANIWRNVSD